MMIEKVKQEISWEVIPVYSKQVANAQDEQNLGEITRAFVDVLVKVVFPNEQLTLISAQPQEARTIKTEESKSNFSNFV